jgi:23S rRNA (uracil1939-C5)-methyltransferase
VSDPGSSGAPPSPRPRKRAAETLARLEQIEVTVEKLVMGGDGLARYEGIPIFVPRAVPGDRLRVRLVQRRPDYGRGAIVEVLEPGPGRRQPPCPHFERCGGCDLQQIEDDLQAPLKAAAVVETLARLGRLDMPEPRLVVGDAWGYRLRAQLHTMAGTSDGARVGYYARGSRDLVAVDRCPVLVPELEGALPGLAAALPEEPPRRLDLAAGGDGRWTMAPVIEGLPRGTVEAAVGEHTYRYDARAFFQGNRGLLPRLVEAAVGSWQGELAADLYAGVGLFSLPLARRYARVIAVEADPAAARHARANGRRHGLEGIEILSRRVELAIEQLPRPCDRLIVDPPRTGLSRAVRDGVLALAPQRLTYVSCDPPTLARDLRALTEAYRVESWTLLDLFPQTGHMEAVVQLVGSGQS